MLGVLETKLVVPKETSGGDAKGAVTEGEANVGEGMRLSELERVEVVGNGVVRCVLEVCRSRGPPCQKSWS